MVEENETVEKPQEEPPPPPASAAPPPIEPPPMIVEAPRLIEAPPLIEAPASIETPPVIEAPRLAAPGMAKLRPAAGPLGGGTRVVIEGTGFVDGCEVKLDCVPVKTSFLSPTELAFTTLPRNLPGSVDVDVINPDGQRTLLIHAFEYCLPPALVSLEPGHAPETGGTRATLIGADLRPEAEVRIGASRPRVDYRGPTRLDLEIGPHPAGTYDVELVNPDGQEARLERAFRYDARPRVDRVIPDHGALAATTRIAIEGDGFRAGCTAYLGGVRLPADVESPTRIVATALQREMHGPLSLRVVNADGLDAELADAFRYDPPPGPSIATVSPGRIPRGREQSAIITGEGFVEGCSVRVADEPVPARFTSPQRLEVSLPSLDRVGFVDLEVINPDAQSCRLPAAFELQGPPQLATVQPREGSDAGGDVLRLSGLAFDPRCEVSIGGFPARTIWEAETTVRAVAPPRALAGAVDVVLTNPDGQSASLACAFTYVARQAPVITGIEPKAGPTTGGTGVLVRGEHLDAVTDVRVGGERANFKFRAGDFAFVTPPRAREGAADVELRTRDGASTVLRNAFQYVPVPPPAIRSLAPNRGGVGGGTEVTIAGENFAQGASVLVEGEPVKTVKVRDASTIVFTTPPGEAGAMVDVTVRSPTGQQAVAKRAFLYDSRYA